MTTLFKASTLGLRLFLLCQYVKRKHRNGLYFHSQNATANPARPYKTLLSPLSENDVYNN